MQIETLQYWHSNNNTNTGAGSNRPRQVLSAGLTTRLTRLQPRAPDFLGAPERPPVPVKASTSLALCVKSVKS